MRMGFGRPKAVMDTIPVVPGGPGDPGRKTDVRKYFKLTPHPDEKDRAERFLRWGGGVLLGAVCVVLVGQAPLAAMIALVAFILLGIGVQEWIDYGRRRKKALPEPTDAAMDDLMSRTVDEVAARAMSRLGISQEMLILHSDDVDRRVDVTLSGHRLAAQGTGPLVVIGPVLTSPRRIGEDQVWRYARNVLMVLCPTEHHLAIYRCEVDLALGSPENEETHEYYYRDIVAMQTVTSPWGPFSILAPSGFYVLDHVFAQERELYITVASAEAAHIVVGLRTQGHPNHEMHLQETGIEFVIDVLRRLLRERKAIGQRP